MWKISKELNNKDIQAHSYGDYSYVAIFKCGPIYPVSIQLALIVKTNFWQVPELSFKKKFPLYIFQ